MKNNKFTFSLAFSLFICLGAFNASAQVSKLQIIHNSPDYIIDTVDVWANDVRIANDLVFRRSTAILNIDSGNYVITISKKFSTDSSSLNSLAKIQNIHFDTSKNYLAFIAGVVDTNDYATNPDGQDRSLTFTAFEREASVPAAQISYAFFNGTPDAGKWDLNEIGLPGLVKVGDDIAFNTISAATLASSANTLFNITSSDSSNIVATYRFNATGLGTRVACVFSSGVMDTVSNPNQAALNGFYVALNNGVVLPLVKLTGGIQIVHNSADVSYDSIDVYINGVLSIDNMPFRSASAFLAQNALVPTSIAFAPKTSTSVANAFNTTNITLDTFVNYYLIAHGVSGSGYAANPNGKSTAFATTQYKGARKAASTSKNVDLLYFHGATDLASTTCRADGQVQFLSKDDAYGEFHGYAAHTALDNINTELLATANDSVLYTGFMNLMEHQGQGGLVLTSGFLNEAANQNGDSLMMIIVWADGDVDSIAPIAPVTGIKDVSFSANQVNVFPNPANENVNLNFSASKSGNYTVTLFDITGKAVYSAHHNLSKGEQAITVPVSNIQNGMYFVNLSLGNESVTRKVTIIK